MWYMYVIAFLSALGAYLARPDWQGWAAAGLILITVGLLPVLGNFLSSRHEVRNLLAPVVGFFIALIAAGLIYPYFKGLPAYVPWVVLGILVALGTYSFHHYQKKVGFSFLKIEPPETEASDLPLVTPKILDTSIIIDGRIIDIASTGFIEGPMIVPNFVLREIQLISDSADPIKRNRGRRGLDMLNTLQKRDDLTVKISYKDYTDTREVDAKLVKLAREIGGRLLTNDFNLNKVAELQDVQVLNINQLANALKPVVLPGEQMDMQIVKEGKDENQGIGYLEDGTMVVVENGGKLQGKKVKVEVTSVIQTNAGKMIFTKVVSR